jgi:hypothetical protein
MNSVSLALGKSPEHIFYKPGFRPQLLEMFRKGEVEMFKHTEWSDTTASRATFQVKIGANKHALIPTTDVAFEVICVCRQPKSEGNILHFLSCKQWMHQVCHLIGHESVAEKIVFLCYSCRISENYGFMSNPTVPDDSAITEAAARINVADQSKLFSHLPEVRSRAKLVLKTMKEYQDLESLISKYNLTTVAKRTGEIYIALLNFCSRSMHRLPFNQTFNDLNPAELTHLSVCIIADILKIDIYPLYRPQIVAIRINFTPLECLQQNRKEIRTISQ